VHVPHHVVVQPIDLAERVQREDVRVRELGGDACLTPETLAAIGGGERARRKNLDGDEPLERALAGQVDGPHGAAAEGP
jgi:hypothetical protein